MKALFLLIIAVLFLQWLLYALPEQDTTSNYPTEPFERCMEAFEGTHKAVQCYEI